MTASTDSAKSNEFDAVGFDPSMVDGIDQSSVEVFDTFYPTIQWVNGAPKNRKQTGMNAWGGFFISEAQVQNEEAMLAGGWTKEELIHESGGETQGFYRRELTIIPITLRERWQVRLGETAVLVGFDRRVKTSKWDAYRIAEKHGNPSGRLQVLCLLVGMESEGPFVLTLGGSVARAFMDERGGDSVLGNFFKSILTAANSKSDAAAKAAGRKPGKRWPARAFHMHVGAARDAAGAPVYTEVGKKGASSFVVFPQALNLPAKGETINLNDWFVGRDMLATVNELYEEAERGWARAWDALLPSEAAAEEPAAAVDHNTAQKMGF